MQRLSSVCKGNLELSVSCYLNSPSQSPSDLSVASCSVLVRHYTVNVFCQSRLQHSGFAIEFHSFGSFDFLVHASHPFIILIPLSLPHFALFSSLRVGHTHLDLLVLFSYSISQLPRSFVSVLTLIALVLLAETPPHCSVPSLQLYKLILYPFLCSDKGSPY